MISEFFDDYTDHSQAADFTRYRTFKDSPYRQVLDAARPLKGFRIIHVNSAFKSGGVAELLKSQVPLENAIGLQSYWLVLKGSGPFFEITKKMHNLLQGGAGALAEGEKKRYLEYDARAAKELSQWISGMHPDLLVLHDPQPLAMISEIKSIPAVSRLHIDLSCPHQALLDFFRPMLEKAAMVVVSRPDFQLPFIEPSRSLVIYPAIDAFSPKHNILKKKEIVTALAAMGLDTQRPIAAQISRFDPWKDPEGVIRAYQIAKRELPDLQLVLAGLISAEDDPEAQGIYSRLKEQYGSDADIHLYGEKVPPGGLSNELFVNALQSGSDVVMQKSTREGFGLTVAEAMFKYQPVIGGNAGGIKLQISDGQNGFLVSSPEECAERMVQLLRDQKLKKHMGEHARKTVEEKFLMPAFLLHHLQMYQKIKELPAVQPAGRRVAELASD